MATDSGYPSSQKLPLGTGVSAEHITVIPTDPYRNAQEVLRFAFRVGSDSVPRTAGATTGLTAEGLYWIEDAATPARRGDFARFETGPAQFLELPIVKVETNRFLISINSGLLPVATNTFYIMRYATQRVDDSGSQVVIAEQGPITFVLDGVDTEVEEDTAVPANSIPLPVKVLNDAGLVPDFATQATLGFVEIHTEATSIVLQEAATGVQPLYVISNPVINTGSVTNISNLVATAQTLTAPANAIGFKIQTPSTNTENVSFTVGAVATISTGILMEPGRSEDFDIGSNISVIATSAAQQRVTVLWKVKP